MTKAISPTITILLLSLILNSISAQEQEKPQNTVNFNENPQEDEQIKKLSQFFIQLINKYDQSGSGLIPIQKYPYFLKDVFIKGTFGTTDHPYLFNELLLKATMAFTATKDQKQTLISIQQFYDDIIQKFTLYLMENSEYQIILDTLFQEMTARDSSKTKQHSQTSEEQIEVEEANKEEIKQQLLQL